MGHYDEQYEAAELCGLRRRYGEPAGIKKLRDGETLGSVGIFHLERQILEGKKAEEELVKLKSALSTLKSAIN